MRPPPRPDKIHIWFEHGYWRFLVPGDKFPYVCKEFQDVLVHAPRFYEHIRKRN